MKGGRRGPVLLIACRFHPDDPIGRRLRQRPWSNGIMCIPLLSRFDDAGASTRSPPGRWPLAELHKVREELRKRDPNERTLVGPVSE